MHLFNRQLFTAYSNAAFQLELDSGETYIRKQQLNFYLCRKFISTFRTYKGLLFFVQHNVCLEAGNSRKFFTTLRTHWIVNIVCSQM